MSTPKPMTPLHRFAHYEVTAKLGEGGMGEVYRATDTRLGREVAIKLLPQEFAKDPDRIARFEREARVLASLSHPNIATMFGLESVIVQTAAGTAAPQGQGGGDDPQNGIVARHQGGVGGHSKLKTQNSKLTSDAPASEVTFLVMELLEGESLRERLAGGPLPYRKAAEIGAAIARGLGAAHDRGIVHRDVKPENVFLTDDGQVKVLDFGLATDHVRVSDDGDTRTPTVTRRTDPGTVLGTAGYMAPEQVRGEQVDSRTDIFALGAVLYEMVTGRQAFRRETAPETMTAILREDPPEPAESGIVMPTALDRLVRRCLEKRPDERFQSARDLGFDLETLATGSGAPSGTAERPLSTRLHRRVPMAWVAVVGFVGIALGGLGAGLLVFRSGGDDVRIRQLTFRRGMVWSARFAPDAGSIVYGAAWEGAPFELFMARIDSVDSRSLELGPADVLAVSGRGEMALSLDRHFTAGWETSGTLATSSLVGSAARPILEEVGDADWGPDGDQLAVVREVEGRFRLEYPLGTVLYETDGWLSKVRVQPKGDLVAFVDHPLRGDNLGRVVVVDRSGHHRVLAENSSQGLAWAPSGDELWTSSGRRLIALTLDGEPRVLYTSTDLIWLQDISKDGRVLVASADIRREMVGRVPGENAERNLSWFDWSSPQALSADGKTVLFDEQNMGGDDGYFVYVRSTGGSPPVKIGNGTGRALSPDGRWALSVSHPFDDPRWVLLPTGPGVARELPEGSIQNLLWAQWLPDGDRLLLAGSKPGMPVGLYLRGLDSEDERLITPGGIDYVRSGYAVSPDGRWVTATSIGGPPKMYSVDGGEPRPIPGLEDHEVPVQWTTDGSALYVFRIGELPARVSLVDVADGRRRPWRDLSPGDTAGVFGIDYLAVNPGGEGYVYSYRRLLSNLYVIKGLK